MAGSLVYQDSARRPRTGQLLAVAIIEVGENLGHRGNMVAIRRTSAHRGLDGNEVANNWAKEAAESTAGAIDRLHLRETSLSKLTRATTEAGAQSIKRCIRNHVDRRGR